MPGRSARIFSPPIQSVSRFGCCCGIAALALVVGSENLQTAVANGDTRTLYFQHTHRDDEITVTFKRNGRYDQDALKKLNWYLRDWRTDDVVSMDPRLFDLLWEVRHEFGDDKPVRIISSYRTPKTNAMLRRRGRGVARHSQHMLGKAIDFYIPDAPLEELRIAGLRLQRGGVGYYPSSGSPFVHMDVGHVRHWPRMSREQLVRVFPNGRTVHIPRDGQPLKNYKLALADIERRGNEPSSSSLVAARDAGVLDADQSGASDHPNRFRLLAKLFGLGNADEDEDRELTSSKGHAVTPRPAAKQPAVVASTENKPDKAEPTKVASAVPLPTKRPPTYQIASAPTRPATFQLASAPSRRAEAASIFATASLSPNEVIKARGYWRGPPQAPAAALSAARRAPRHVAAAKLTAAPETTASVTPWPVKGQQNDRVSPELALAYAAQERPRPAQQAAPMGTRMPANLKTAAIAPQTTVATKATSDQPTTALTAQNLLAAAARAHNGRNQGYDPWLRAMMIAPDARRFMSTALFGVPDYRKLRPLMQKPSSAVMMTFAVEPYLDLDADRFAGSAIVFVSTVTFVSRSTAALQ